MVLNMLLLLGIHVYVKQCSQLWKLLKMFFVLQQKFNSLCKIKQAHPSHK